MGTSQDLTDVLDGIHNPKPKAPMKIVASDTTREQYIELLSALSLDDLRQLWIIANEQLWAGK